LKEIILSGDVGYEITAASIREQLDMNSSATVRLKINSPGGHVFEAFEIYNLIKEYKGTVIAEITGMAASAASYIALGADKLQVHKNSTLMLHRAWNIAIGNSVSRS
jgi:ATP-dependent protease ClpP protease subunit